jgi:SAM-dependent methyltransferase
MKSSTLRFTGRVENYIKYRPGYPGGMIETLVKECGLTKDSIVADIGSGTGILSGLFLKNGNRVFGVEPNREMREAGERLLQRVPNIHEHYGHSGSD